MSLHLTAKMISTQSKDEPCYMQERMNNRIFKKGIQYSEPFEVRKHSILLERIRKDCEKKRGEKKHFGLDYHKRRQQQWVKLDAGHPATYIMIFITMGYGTENIPSLRIQQGT